MKDGLLIVGNGGQGKVVLDCAKANGFKKIAFLVNYNCDDVLGIKCINENNVDFSKIIKEYPYLIVALGDNYLRLEKSIKYKELGFELVTLIHPTAFVSEYADIDMGSVVLPFAVVNSCATLGMACIVNTGALVEHDCILADGVSISPNAAMGGNVKIGKNSWICIGASIKNDITIGKNCVIGAGATVFRDIDDDSVVVGENRKINN